MARQIREQGRLYRDAAVQQIATIFGREFTYVNANGKLAINRLVLREFLGITRYTVVWSTSDLSWRRRGPDDPRGRVQD